MQSSGQEPAVKRTVEPPATKRPTATLLAFAGSRRFLAYGGCALSAISMLLGFVPYIAMWLVARDLIAVAPNWRLASGIGAYGWFAFGAAMAGILVYFAALMCTHLAAFRTASNIRKRCCAHLMGVSLGYFDAHASGELRRVIDGCAGATETLLAHKLPDTAGSAALMIGTLALLFVFDWRMGLACLAAAVISFACMFAMMGGSSKNFMLRYQQALVNMSKTGTEYVRGIPVVKVFQQTVYSFKAFHDAIKEYSDMAENYSVKVCQGPQCASLSVINGIAVLLVPTVLFLAPGTADIASFATDYAFYAIFSAVIATAMTRMMFCVEELQIATDVVTRVNGILAAPTMAVRGGGEKHADRAGTMAPTGKRAQAHVPGAVRDKRVPVEFRGVCFGYEGSESAALTDVSFLVPAGSTVALVGPSGGGKTTAAGMVARFWDASAGSVLVDGIDVRDYDPHELMKNVAFVFQNSRLFKQSIFDRQERSTIGTELMGGFLVNGAQVVLRLGFATTILVATGLVLDGQIDFMAVFCFLLVISRIYAPFDQALMMIYELFASRVAAGRMNALYSEPVAGGTTSFTPAGYDISFDDVCFSYNAGTAQGGPVAVGAERVLRGVTFTAREGEVTALVGPSGGGKSTCAKLAARFWDVDGGRVTLGGVDIAGVDPETLLTSYAVVFQDVLLFDDTVMGNIRLGRKDATDEEVLAAARAANCDEFALRLPQGYQTPIGENGARLSGGERQRVSIARALLKGAPVVLLDEATASLDVENETQVQQALSHLLAGKTVLVIAHRMRTVLNADKVVVLAQGRVVEQGAPADLLAHAGAFARMVELQKGR